MRDAREKRRLAFRPRRLLLRLATIASAVTLGTLVVGVGAAAGDTHTGFQLVIDCGDRVFTVVTPTSPAAAAQDVTSTRVLVVAVGNIVSASGGVPENRVMTCTFVASTGETLTFPFLIAPATH